MTRRRSFLRSIPIGTDSAEITAFLERGGRALPAGDALEKARRAVVERFSQTPIAGRWLVDAEDEVVALALRDTRNELLVTFGGRRPRLAAAEHALLDGCTDLRPAGLAADESFRVWVPPEDAWVSPMAIALDFTPDSEGTFPTRGAMLFRVGVFTLTQLHSKY